MFALAYGAAFGAIQQMPRIVPGMPEVAALEPAAQRAAAGAVQSWQEVGGLAGRTALAMLVLAIVSRRRLLWIFQVPGLVIVPLTFWLAQSPGTSVATVSWMMFFAGFFTVAQFSFWGNYLPRVYPTYLRGTGEGFAARYGATLHQIAGIYRRQVDSRAGMLRTILPAFMIIVTAGLLTAMFVLSVMLPMVKLLEGLSK